MRNKKKLVGRHLLACLIALTALLPVLMGASVDRAYAATTTYGDYTVESVRDGSTYYAKITKYNGSDTDLVLPDVELSTPIEFNQYISASSIKAIDITLTAAQKKSIKSVKIPEGYVTVSGFSGATALETINIPSTTTMLNASAFKDCTSLKDISFADNATNITINSMCFSGCTSLKEINLPSGAAFGNNLNVFYGCSALESINIAGEGGDYFSDNGILYRKDGDNAKLITYPEGRLSATFTLPEKAGERDVISTGMHTFRNNQVLEDVTVPASYASLGGYIFDGASKLMKVSIKSDAFSVDDSGSSLFTNIAAGSVVYVANEDIKNAIESSTSYSGAKDLYTETSTTIEVDSIDISYDVNGDGVVDLLDVTTAQLGYMKSSVDSDWDEFKGCDVNGDETIDIQDLILIFKSISAD